MATTLVNARCYLAHIVEMISTLRKEMHMRHWEILRGTSFGHLMDDASIIQERGVLDALLQVYDNRNQRFKIGESILPFKAEDVALILGLCCEGDIVSFKHKRVLCDFE